MHPYPLIKFLSRVFLVFITILLVAKPYNWYCNMNQSCKPFYFAYYMPKTEGKRPIEVSLEVANYRTDLVFSVENSFITTVANRKNIASYRVKNISDHVSMFQPELYFKQANFEKYVKRYRCLCFHNFKLKPGESIDLAMEFEINTDIEKEAGVISYAQKDAVKNDVISLQIGYRIK